MPIRVAVENRDKLRLVVYIYSGHIRPADVLDSVRRAAAQLAPKVPYRELLIFNHDTDLSDFDREFLVTFHRQCEELYRELKLGSRTAAAMLDNSIDAKLIMPLFNALSLVGPGADLSFELFTEVEPALERLGIPLEEGLRIIARAT